MWKKILTFGVLALIFVIVIAGAKNTRPNEASGKMLVTASFYPLTYLAQEIGGNKVTVLNLTPAGAEPHEFEPSARDMAEMERSHVLIVNGLGLEPWYKNAKENINPQKTTIIAVGNGLDNKDAIKDPHVWLSPSLMKIMAEKIEKTFSKVDPKNEYYYKERLLNLKTKLDTLDEKFRFGLMNCERREIITSHTAFKYLAEDYGLTQISIAGLSPDAEPSPKTLSDIVNFAKQHNVKYIFFESLVSPKLARTIANEIGAKTLVLNPIEGLTKQDISKGKNYINVMQENLTNLQTALSCTTLEN
jgi:zinc transport system substrate-binding protein